MLELKRAFTDGTTHVLFEPEDFIARLAALVPQPHLLSDHGLFAPNAPERRLMVLDVEGWELPILSTFSPQFRPTTLVVEMHPLLDTLSLTREDFLTRLHEIGYSTFTLNGLSVADWSERLPEDNVIATVFSHDEVTWSSSSIDE